MRRLGLALALGALVVVPVARGASPTVTSNSDAYSNYFKPAKVTVNVGDTVHWHNNRGEHNVHFLKSGKKIGGAPVTHAPSTAHWDAQFTFTSAGTFKYICDKHADPSGAFGMVGTVTVVDPNAPPPAVSNLTAKPASFCTNRSQTCSKRGTKVKFTLSARAKVSGQIRPKGTSKPFATIFHGVQKPAGRDAIDYAGKGLRPGRYVLRVRARGANGKLSPYAKTTVRVVKNG